MTKKEVAQVLAILKTVYPNTKSIDNPEATVMAWEMVLGDYSSESVMKAAKLHISTEKFFPSPCEIRDKIVKAHIVYKDSEIDRLEQGEVKLIGEAETEDIDEKLEELCKFVGLGYDVGME